METLELKNRLLKILGKTEDEHLLRTVYDFLKQGRDPKVGQIWTKLSQAQRKEVYSSYEESEKESNLKAWNELKKKY